MGFRLSFLDAPSSCQFVADAVQHNDHFRSKVYSDIGWNKDHPVLLRIKRRFNPVSTRVSGGI